MTIEALLIFPFLITGNNAIIVIYNGVSILVKIDNGNFPAVGNEEDRGN